MSAETTRCPKCNGEMVQGFIVDHHAGGKRLVSNWVAGPPQKSFWHSTDVPADKCIPVGTFRCSACGFLESYARRSSMPSNAEPSATANLPTDWRPPAGQPSSVK